MRSSFTLGSDSPPGGSLRVWRWGPFDHRYGSDNRHDPRNRGRRGGAHMHRLATEGYRQRRRRRVRRNAVRRQPAIAVIKGVVQRVAFKTDEDLDEILTRQTGNVGRTAVQRRRCREVVSTLREILEPIFVVRRRSAGRTCDPRLDREIHRIGSGAEPTGGCRKQCASQNGRACNKLQSH